MGHVLVKAALLHRSGSLLAEPHPAAWMERALLDWQRSWEVHSSGGKKKKKYFFYSSENKWFAVFANTQPGLKNNTPVWIRMTASYSLNCKVMWAYPLALSTASLAVILHALCSVLPCLSSPPTPYHFVLGTVIVSANSRPLLKSTLSSWKYNWKISSLQWLHT